MSQKFVSKNLISTDHSQLNTKWAYPATLAVPVTVMKTLRLLALRTWLTDY